MDNACSAVLLPASRTALVVGGCGGIGHALVGALLDQGVQVAVMDLPGSLQSRSLPDGVAKIAVDLRDEASVAARSSHGGTAPEQVRLRVAQARLALGMES